MFDSNATSEPVNYYTRHTPGSAKHVMLEWLQALLPSCNVTNFTSDWADGKFLMALINEVTLDPVPPTDRPDYPLEGRNNCAAAIRIASANLRVPPILRPEDLSSGAADELSVITYLSYFSQPAESALLTWVKSVAPDLHVTNFSSDWSDGVALAAILETCSPGSFPDWRLLRREASADNVARVFTATRARHNVCPSVTVEELASGSAEDLKTMTYVLRIRRLRDQPKPSLSQFRSKGVTVSGPGLSTAVAGKQTHFVVHTGAGPQGAALKQLRVSGRDSRGGEVKVTLADGHGRRDAITATYTPPRVCEHIKFEVLWTGQQVPNSPFFVTVQDGNPVCIVDRESRPTVVLVSRPVQLDVRVNTSSSPHGTVYGGNLTARFVYDGFSNNNDGNREMASVPVHMTTLAGEVGGRASAPSTLVTLTYTPTLPGEATLRLFWKGEELPDLAVHYTVVDHKAYQVTSYPQKRLCSTMDTAHFSVRSHGPPLAHLQITAIHGDLQVPIAFHSFEEEGGLGHASFVPTLPGRFRVEVACAGQLVVGSPFIVEVTDPSKCSVRTPLPRHMAVGTEHEFVVSTGEAGEGDVMFTCSDEQGRTQDNFHTSLQRDTDGTQRLHVTPLAEGVFLVGLTFGGAFIRGSPFSLVTCRPSRCLMIGQYKGARVGVPVFLTVSVSNPMVKPVVKATGKTANYNVAISTSDNINYSVSFVPWEVGRNQIDVTYGSFHIPDSPVVFDVYPPGGRNCTATGAGLQSAQTLVPAQFTVLTGMPGLLDNGSLTVSVAGVVNKVEGRVRMRDNQDGTYSVAYLVHEQGAYLISVVVFGHHIVGSPFRLTAHPGPMPHKCVVFGSALDEEAMLMVGRPIEFAVDTTGAGSGDLAVKAVGPQGTEAKVFVAQRKRGGVHEIKLEPQTGGKHRVSVKWAGYHVPGSPFVLKIWSGADPSKCSASGPGLLEGVVGRPTHFTVDTRSAGAGVLVIRIDEKGRQQNSAFNIDLRPADELDRRRLVARYTPQIPGDFTVSLLWSDQHIPGSPFRVRIKGQVAERPRDEIAAALATPIHSHLDLVTKEVEGQIHPVIKTSSLPSSFKGSANLLDENMPNFARSSLRTNIAGEIRPKSAGGAVASRPSVSPAKDTGKAKAQEKGAQLNKQQSQAIPAAPVPLADRKQQPASNNKAKPVRKKKPKL